MPGSSADSVRRLAFVAGPRPHPFRKACVPLRVRACAGFSRQEGALAPVNSVERRIAYRMRLYHVAVPCALELDGEWRAAEPWQGAVRIDHHIV